jgi:bifunctional non-homologous end joining protein LigD
VSPARLQKYRTMREFGRTPEPAGGPKAAARGIYVVQKHAATRLHYDFRLELDGTLRSWAVPREPSLDPSVKRLAVEVEDHPIEYAKFAGTIPKGQYGAGKVEIWDKGRWQPEGDPRKDLKRGRLHFALEGGRLAGRWILVRMEGPDEDPKKPQWLLMRAREQATNGKAPRAATSGKAPASGKAAAIATRTKATKAPKAAPAALPRKRPAARSAPIPEHVEFQLATLSSAAPVGDDWLHEIKLDGYRAQATFDRGRVRIRTRRGHDWTDRFPVVARALAKLDARTALLDGELVVLREDGSTDFQALQNALQEGKSQAVVFCVFDLLHEDGEDLLRRPLEERKARLAALLERSPGEPALRFVKHAVGEGPALFADACRLGLEGVISKRRDAPYTSGRGRAWLKTKCVGRQEFVIGGFTTSPGGRDTLASILLGVHDEDSGKLRPVGRAGTGMSDAERTRLLRLLRPLAVAKSPFDPAPPAGDRRGAVTWVKPRHVAEVEFRAWTNEGLLRQASYKGLREDTRPRDVVRERPRALAEAPAARRGASRGIAKKAPATSKSRASGAAGGGVRLSNPDKVLFPDVGVTKARLLDYYRIVAERMLPHVVGRPLMILRCPNGVGTPCFYQKHPAKAEAARATSRSRAKADEEEWLSIRDQRGLEELVQSGALEIHAWGARLDRLEQPDRLAFDLDPGPGVSWAEVVRATHDVRARLRALKLESFLKTTGGKGLHVVVPIARRPGWDTTKAFCQALAKAMEKDEPKRYTAALSKAKRPGRIFIDYLRNGRGSTWVVPYSTRAREGATMSMPLPWEALTARLDPKAYNVPAILKKGLPAEDPWAGIGEVRQTLPRPPA